MSEEGEHWVGQLLHGPFRRHGVLQADAEKHPGREATRISGPQKGHQVHHNHFEELQSRSLTYGFHV